YGRGTATGKGLVHCVVQWAEDHKFNLNGCSFTVQGFGNVGSWAAKILAKMGATLVGVGDYKGYLANPEGMNPHKLSEHVAHVGSVEGYKGAHAVSRDEFFARDRGGAEGGQPHGGVHHRPGAHRPRLRRARHLPVVVPRYNRSYTPSMKTAISVPDKLFQQAERIAKRRRVSRSQLYASALQEL